MTERLGEGSEASAVTPASDRAGRLLELAVTDLALIDRLRLALEPGLNVLTGETGAGKTMVVSGLGLLLLSLIHI